MITWKALSDEEARRVWDQTLARFSDRSPFQTYAWGEYRRSLGWQPCRLAAFDEHGEIVAMMQGSLRHFLGFGLVWSEGGPIGDLSVCDARLQTALKRATRLKRIYCRFRCDRPRNIEDALRLRAQGWTVPWSPLTTSYSMALTLSQPEEVLLAACGRGWHRNLRRSEKRNLTTRQWLDPNADEVFSVFQSMQNLKGLEEQQSREEIDELLKNLGEHFVLYRCDDEQGKLLSLGGALIIGPQANAWLAATTERGRKLYASYAVLWALVRHCRKIGVRTYDLAGIDPVRNRGVYNFKRGTGAKPLEYLGEWDWASSSWWRWFGNWVIAQRHRIRGGQASFKNSRVVKHKTEPSSLEHPGSAAPKSKIAAQNPRHSILPMRG